MSAAPATARKLRVLLVDDQPPFRMAARSLLEADDTYVVVGEASDGESAVALAHSLQPELILMDVRLPGMNGIEATRRILIRDPATIVVLLSTHQVADLPAGSAPLRCGGLPPQGVAQPDRPRTAGHRPEAAPVKLATMTGEVTTPRIHLQPVAEQCRLVRQARAP